MIKEIDLSHLPVTTILTLYNPQQPYGYQYFAEQNGMHFQGIITLQSLQLLLYSLLYYYVFEQFKIQSPFYLSCCVLFLWPLQLHTVSHAVDMTFSSAFNMHSIMLQVVIKVLFFTKERLNFQNLSYFVALFSNSRSL